MDAEATNRTGRVMAEISSNVLFTVKLSTCLLVFSMNQVSFVIEVSLAELSSYPGYFGEPHGLSMGVPEISRVT